MIVVQLALLAVLSVASLACAFVASRDLLHDHRRRSGHLSARHRRYLEQHYFRECDMWIGD